MTNNPYASPATDIGPSEEAALRPGDRTLAGIARPTFVAWERLRVIYVILLAVLTVSLAGSSITRIRTIVVILEGAIIANVCYFAGPIGETYVRWLGYDGKWLRGFLFVAGTLFTAILAVVAMAGTLLPDQN
ncbi:MAG: hypothetical protein ACTHK7_09805 [Aureliella sp.]